LSHKEACKEKIEVKRRDIYFKVPKFQTLKVVENKQTFWVIFKTFTSFSWEVLEVNNKACWLFLFDFST